MEKLIELLNEYEYSLFEDKSLAPQRWDIQDWVVFEKDFCKDLDKPRDLAMDVTHLISHRFSFIKWLVDNDKIDNKKIPQFGLVGWYTDFEYSEYENLLMVLAIQDEPIEFLLSIIK